MVLRSFTRVLVFAILLPTGFMARNSWAQETNAPIDSAALSHGKPKRPKLPFAKGTVLSNDLLR